MSRDVRRLILFEKVPLFQLTWNMENANETYQIQYSMILPSTVSLIIWSKRIMGCYYCCQKKENYSCNQSVSSQAHIRWLNQSHCSAVLWWAKLQAAWRVPEKKPKCPSNLKKSLGPDQKHGRCKWTNSKQERCDQSRTSYVSAPLPAVHIFIQGYQSYYENWINNHWSALIYPTS